MSIDGKYQVPTVAVHTDIFDRVTQSVARVNGMPRMRQAYVPQPIMGKTPRAASRLHRRPRHDHRPPVHAGGDRGADRAARRRGRQAAARSTGPRRACSSRTPRRTCIALFQENHWTDYLPIVLPTEERVEAMLEAHQPRAGRDHRPHAPDQLPRVLGVHGREGRRQRGHGRRAAGVLPGDPGDGRLAAPAHAAAPPARRRRCAW